MNLEDIRNKYQCDETFAQWKEWVRKNKPSHAETHIVTAVAPNGSKFEKLIGGYTDAQNSAFSLVAHGYKNVKMFKSVNAGPMKLLRNFSAPLHGAKFKDSVDEIREKYAMDAAMGIKISGNEKGTERLTMEKVFKEWLSPAAAWQKVKKGNTIMIRFNGNGPNKKLKGKDVLKIEYFNPNVVAMTPRSGGTQLVGLQRINVMAGKLASEGLRSYPEFENMLLKKDSADDFASDAVDGIRNKYQCDAWNHLDREMKRKIISHLKTRWKFSDAIINRFIRDFDGDFSMFIKEKMSWPEITKFLDTRAKKVDVNPYSSSYRHSLLVEKGKMKQPGNKFDKLGSGKNPLKVDSVDNADCVDRIRSKYSTDAYNLGMETKEFDPKAPLKVISVTTKKEPDGISGRVTFTKGQKKTSERFMVYKSGNWDVTPGGGFGITGITAGDKQALMNAVRNKLSTMGIKAK